VLAVPGNSLAAFAGDLLTSLGVHCSGASGTRAAWSLALYRASLLALRGNPLLRCGHSAMGGMSYLRALCATFHRLGFRPRLLGILRVLLAVIWHSSSVTG
jgi:hypothetical protein